MGRFRCVQVIIYSRFPVHDSWHRGSVTGAGYTTYIMVLTVHVSHYIWAGKSK